MWQCVKTRDVTNPFPPFFDLAGVDDQQLSVLWQRQLSEALSGKHHIQARVTKDIIGTFAEAVGKDALHPYFTI